MIIPETEAISFVGEPLYFSLDYLIKILAEEKKELETALACSDSLLDEKEVSTNFFFLQHRSGHFST